MQNQSGLTNSEYNKRLKQATQEAEFRFKSLGLAAAVSKTPKELFKNATDIYNYAFHITPSIAAKDESKDKPLKVVDGKK